MVFEYVLRKALQQRSQGCVPSKKIKIKSGIKTLIVDQDEIALLHSKAGLVIIQMKSDRKLVTEFSSLDDVQSHLSEFLFFRVSRQLLIHRDSIVGFTRQLNKRLQVDLSLEYCNQYKEEAIVSRYRSRKFKEWVSANYQKA